MTSIHLSYLIWFLSLGLSPLTAFIIVIYNKNAIEWPKAKEDWTKGSDEIRYIGLYSKVNTPDESSESESQKSEYFLMGVLPLAPSETVLINEQMVLNANSIVIKLSNR